MKETIEDYLINILAYPLAIVAFAMMWIVVAWTPE
jgi:hypothetical protein